MVADVERVVRECSHCIQVAPKPIRSPLIPWPNTGTVWSRIHIDLGEPTRGKVFIIVVDSFSKYLDAQWLGSTTSEAVIFYLRRLFRHFGPPETIVSDNGRQFTSTEFAHFCSEFNVVHLRSAPYMPQSNGQAERMVRTIKSSLENSTNSLDSVVMTYNYTPCSSLDEKSPGEVFFGRNLRTPFDCFKPQERKSELSEYQKGYKRHFDKHHGTRARKFVLGENVTIRLANGNKVTAAVVEFVGNAMLKLKVNEQILVRHLNQVWKLHRGSKTNLLADEALDQFSTSAASQESKQSSPPVSLTLPEASQLSEPPTADDEPAVQQSPTSIRVQPVRRCKKSVNYRSLSGAT